MFADAPVDSECSRNSRTFCGYDFIACRRGRNHKFLHHYAGVTSMVGVGRALSRVPERTAIARIWLSLALHRETRRLCFADGWRCWLRTTNRISNRWWYGAVRNAGQQERGGEEGGNECLMQEI